MRRSLLIIVGSLAIAGGVFAACYLVAAWLRTSTPTVPPDELDWLRVEFRLSDAEMARIRLLHEGYLPECAAMCQRVEKMDRELEGLLAASTNITSAVEQKLAVAAVLRAECQAQMLRHFQQVSQTMPAEQGRRYFAEMRRLTLGVGKPAGMTGANIHRHGQP